MKKSLGTSKELGTIFKVCIVLLSLIFGYVVATTIIASTVWAHEISHIVASYAAEPQNTTPCFTNFIMIGNIVPAPQRTEGLGHRYNPFVGLTGPFAEYLLFITIFYLLFEKFKRYKFLGRLFLLTLIWPILRLYTQFSSCPGSNDIPNKLNLPCISSLSDIAFYIPAIFCIYLCYKLIKDYCYSKLVYL